MTSIIPGDQRRRQPAPKLASPPLAAAPVRAGFALGVPVGIAAAEGSRTGLARLIFTGVALLLSAGAKALLGQLAKLAV